MFASLSVRNYRLRFIGGLFGNVGTWMQRTAQDWIVLTLLSDDSGLAVGIVTALQFGPSLFLSTYGGLLADRLDRRKLLIATQVAQAVLAFILGGLVLTHTAQLWHVYVLGFVLGCVTAIDGPVNQTFVSQLVPSDLLVNAIALNSANFNLSRMVGPAAAGLLVAWIGPGWVFIINGASFAATIAALALIRARDLRDTEHVPRQKGQIREGIRYVAHRGDIIVIMVVMGVVSCFGLNGQVTQAVMARNEFGRDAGEYGILGSIFAIGALCGSLMAARRSRTRVRLVVFAALAYGIAYGLSALSPTYWVYALSGVVVGFAMLTLITSANATLQMSVPPQVRGRVMSLYLLVFMGPTPLGSPFIGWVAGAWGPRWSIGVGAIACVAVALWAIVWVKRHWSVEVHVEGGHVLIHNPVSDDAREAVAEAVAEAEAEDAAEAEAAAAGADAGAEPAPGGRVETPGTPIEPADGDGTLRGDPGGAVKPEDHGDGRPAADGGDCQVAGDEPDRG
jgi:MFS family permease